MAYKLINGSSLEELKKLPEKSINMCMTSPPYWALRDYGVEGQLGLEPTFDEYINDLCDIFDGVKRVLRDDGTCWVNLGDTYYGSGAGTQKNFPENDNRKETYIAPYNSMKIKQRNKDAQYKSKCLIGIPMRFAIEMVNRGWILRNTIIWHKPNAMPSSVKDRFTVDFEYIFFFSKKKKYYFEQQLEPTITKDKIVRDRDSTRLNNTPGRTRMGGLTKNDYDFKNKRTTWSICPKPFKEAHFAVYPEELCETPIKAGCPEFVCVKCGNPKVIEKIKIGEKEVPPIGGIKHTEGNFNDTYSGNTKQNIYKEKLISTCSCNVEFVGGIVLDPFAGAGTTGLVSEKQNKNSVLIELNPEYCEIIDKRLKPYVEQKILNFGSYTSGGTKK